MSYVNVKYRLMIEGFQTEWVSDSSLAGTMADTRVRRDGLIYDGIALREKLDLREGMVKAGGMTFQIRSPNAMAEFATTPAVLTRLEEDVDYNETAVDVLRGGAVAQNAYVHVGTEVWKVTGIASNTWTVSRQQWDTQAQEHVIELGEEAEDVYVYDRPPTMNGRRAYLFMYKNGATSDEAALFDFVSDYKGSALTTTDTLIWRGVVSQHPVLDSDGMTWLIPCEPITMLLDQEVAAMADKRQHITGVYHNYADCFTIQITQMGASPETSTYKLTGHFPDESSFVDAVNDYFDTWLTGISVDPPTVLRLSDRGPGGPQSHRLWMTGAPNGVHPFVRIYSGLEGCFGGGWWEDIQTGGAVTTAGMIPGRMYVADLQVDSITIPMGVAHLPAPRSGFGMVHGVQANTGPLVTDATVAADYPCNRVYFTGDLAIAINDEIIIRCKDANGDAVKLEGTVIATGTSGRDYIDVDTGTTPFTYYVLDSETTIEPRRAYVEMGHVADFISSVIDEAIHANRGDTPFITWADFYYVADGAGWRGEVEQRAGELGEMGNRRFIYEKPETLREIIREELKLLGFYMHLASDGRMTLSRLKPTTQVDLEAVVLTDALDIVTPYDNHGMWPTWEPDRDGIVGIVEIYPGYNVEEGDTEGMLFRVRHVDTISKYKNRGRGKITIEPKSGTVAGLKEIDPATAWQIAKPLLGYHGARYNVVKLKCRLGLFDAALDGLGTTQSLRAGDGVLITSNFVIDPSTGTRGVTALPGVVIDAAYPLDGSRATCELSVRIPQADIAAYAPAARIVAATQVSGNIWDLTLTENMFAPTGLDDEDFFTVGDRIMVWEYNTAAPGVEDGVITSITDATHMRLTLDATAPWGAGGAIVYDLTYDIDDGNLQSAQYDYAFVADNDGSRVTGSADEFA